MFILFNGVIASDFPPPPGVAPPPGGAVESGTHILIIDTTAGPARPVAEPPQQGGPRGPPFTGPSRGAPGARPQGPPASFSMSENLQIDWLEDLVTSLQSTLDTRKYDIISLGAQLASVERTHQRDIITGASVSGPCASSRSESRKSAGPRPAGGRN